MNLTKDSLEKGIIIRRDGTITDCKRRNGLQEGELLDTFSEIGVRSEIKIDGRRNLAHKNGVLITKTFKQAMMEVILTQFYALCCLKEKGELAGDG